MLGGTKVLAKFTLYDFIAVIIPGAFLLWAAGAVSHAPELAVVTLGGGFAEASVFIVLSYIVGLILSAASEQLTEKLLLAIWRGYPSARWLLDEDTTFSEQYKAEFWICLRKTFDTERPTAGTGADRPSRLRRNQEVFYRCYRSVEKVSEMPQIFNAQYGLFRSLLTAFVFLGIIGLGNILARGAAGMAVGRGDIRTLALLLAGAVASYWRVKKRGEDFARAVFDGFLSNFGRNAPTT
jgi:hypothetical protein